MKCLNKFSYNEFKDFIDELDLQYWTVWNTNIEERLTHCTTSNRFQYLLNLAKEKGLTSSPAEILSWLDSLKILKETLKEVPQNILEKLTIVQEYQIPFSRKRADYLLIFQNKVLILEFSFKYEDTEIQFENKTIQILGYKERLIDLLPSHIEIGTYTYLIQPELEPDTYENILKSNKYTEIEDLANSENNNSLANYITLFFNKEKDSALTHLCYLDTYETTEINMIKSKKENEIRIQNKIDSNTIDDADISELIEVYNQICKKFPDYVVIIQDKDVEDLFYAFNKAAEILCKETSYMRIDETTNVNGKIYYRKFINSKQYLVEKITPKYNLAIGTCIEDLELYD